MNDRGTAAALRRAFDDAFAAAPASRDATSENVLAIRVAGDPYVVRLAEIASLHVDAKVVPIPSPIVELRGLAGFRHAVIPVYDLSALLGYAGGPAGRWLLIARREAVGLAFDHLDAHVRVEAADASATGDARRGHVHGAMRIAGEVRPLINLASVLDAIGERARGRSERRE